MADPSAKKNKYKDIDLRRQPGFHAIAYFCLICLYAPVVVLIIFSFNDNRSVVRWTEFSFRWYREVWNDTGMQTAAWTSIKIAFVATVLATTFATMAAMATTRVKPYRGMNIVFGIINQPLMIPEIVTAIATLSLFSLIKKMTGINGIGYIMAAHTAFCIPFAFMPIRARLQDMTLVLEQAAGDLYATPFKAFRYVTLPLVMPGIVAGAMLAFVVSLDDVIITLMVAGPGETTLPIYILGAIRRGITPEINAASTILVALSGLLVTAFFFIQKRSNRR